MTYRVEIASEALQRIRAQARNIAEEAQAPLNAQRWLRRILGAADTLERMPGRFPLAREDASRPCEIRAMHVAGFVLLFTINDDQQTVSVLSARHSRQLPDASTLPTDL